MSQNRLFSILIIAGAWIAFGAGTTWSQTAPAPEKGQTEMKQGKGERTGEEKMEARGAQEPGRMETDRKKGEVEMEARGAQKPGRMEKEGAEAAEAKETLGERWTKKEDVRKVQAALKNKGYDPGSIDGVMGSQTAQAIRAFQSASGLKETGRVDAETAKKLGVEKGTASGASSERGSSSSAPTAMPKESSSPMGK